MKRIPALLLVSALAQVLASSTPLVAREADPELPGLEDVRDVDLPALLAAGGRCVTADSWGEGERRHPGKERELRLDAEIQIPVAFHVIYQEIYSSGTWKKVGDVSTTRIKSQIQVLNDAFAGTGIRFVLRSVDRRKNSTWFAMTMGSAAERDAKAALAIDPAHVLNVYSAGLASSALGWAYYPWAFPESNWMHGLVIQHGTIPGGKLRPYHLGDTAVHELGHYFGLYHTFQGGCTTPGDQVADTPSEVSPAYGCPINRDTCPSPGLDPTQNFMDYTDDACMYELTAGQDARMDAMYSTYRSAADRFPVRSRRPRSIAG
jgi:hypothetical protein